MPTPVVAGCLQAAVVQDYAGQTGENVLHFNASGVTTALGLQHALEVIRDAWIAAPLVHQAGDCRILRVDGLMLNGPGSLYDTVDATPPVAGSSDSWLHSQVESLCLTKWSGLSGRANRGRIYIGGIPQNTIVEGKFDAGFANDMRGAMNDFMAAVAADGFPLVILSRSQGVMLPMNEFKLHDLSVDTQRRRLPDHNRHH